jgi:hypothetical protein
MPRGDESAATSDPHSPRPTIEIDLGKAVALLGLDNRLKGELAANARGPSETELSRAVRQLGAMLQSVHSDPDVIALNVTQPVFKLYQALTDLCAGHKPAFLFEVKRPPDVTTKPKIAFAHYPQGVLAIGYAGLVERGRYKPAKAIKWFDDELRTCKMPAKGNDVRGWYRQATAPTGKPAAGLMQAFREFQPRLLQLPLHDAAEAENFAKKCVTAVHGMGLVRLKLVRPHTKKRLIPPSL